MINNKEFSKRLQKIIDYYSESASGFAQKIDVQRSSISHILSGRNKPSLEFVLKILDTYPEVELYWLLNGKGHFPKKDYIETNNFQKKETSTPQNLFSENEASQKYDALANKHIEEQLPTSQNSSSKKEIDRIVIFYKDGSFSNFEN